MATRKQPTWRQDRAERFGILHRDKFTCRYCGSTPGCDLLEVDHLVPRSRGGSDHHLNKVAACKTCNSRKSDSIVFPHDLIERTDEEGWHVHKTYGEWAIVFCDTEIGIEKQHYGLIHGFRLFDRHLASHMYEKTWDISVFVDMEKAFSHLKTMLCDPREDGFYGR